MAPYDAAAGCDKRAFLGPDLHRKHLSFSFKRQLPVRLTLNAQISTLHSKRSLVYSFIILGTPHFARATNVDLCNILQACKIVCAPFAFFLDAWRIMR